MNATQQHVIHKARALILAADNLADDESVRVEWICNARDVMTALLVMVDKSK